MEGWKTVSIAGIGLIGGSIGMALRKQGIVENVIGIGRPGSNRTLSEALRLGAITSVAENLEQAVADADIVVVCAPVNSIPEIVLQAATFAPNRALLTDAGSTKAAIVATVEARLPVGKRFVGSHPLAGSEKAGVQFARADLFEGRVVVVTPTYRTKDENTNAISEFWSLLGAKVVKMSPEMHDVALAGTSHLPHVIASALAAVTPPNDLPLTAGGWRDVTRIAAADPTLWAQILLENRANVLKSLTGFETKVQAFRTAMECGDPAQLIALLTEGKQVRDALGD